MRGRPVDEAHRHGAVGGMVDRALALDDDPVSARLALLDQPLHGAIREVADDPIDGHAPALDHHPGLAGRDHGRRRAVAPRGRDQLQGHGHLADRAVGPDRQDHPLARAMTPPDGGLHPVGRPAVVDQASAGRRGRRRELRVIAEELMQPGVDIEARPDRLEDRRPPRRRQPPARRGDPDQQPVRPDRAVERLVERRGEGHVEGRQEFAQVAARHRRIEDRHDLVVAVADDADRGLGVVDPELSLGQDDQSSGFVGVHLPILGKRGRARGVVGDARGIDR